MKEWDWEKNTLDPATLTAKSAKAPWWKCARGHSWQSKVYNRSRGQGCPYCSNHRADEGNSLAALRPDLAKEWHPTRNGALTPDDVTPGSGREVWWQCPKGHEWKAIVYNRARQSGCPYCANQRVLPQKSLAACFPALAAQWDEANQLTAWEVSPGSGRAVWWRCQAGHRWKAKIYSRIAGSGCPYCANRKMDKSNSLASLFPGLAAEWHKNKNNGLRPDQAAPHSGRKVWWRCERGHEWYASISSRSAGNGCPYCANRLVDESNSLKTLYPKLAAEWHKEKNAPLAPEQVPPGCDRQVFWQCARGHVWKAAIYQRTAGHGCPQCAGALGTSFPEQAIYYYLSKVFFAQSRARIAGREIDIFLPEYRIGIEYDGLYFHPPELWWREEQKDRLLAKLGIQIIRVKEAQESAVDWERRRICCVYKAGYSYLSQVVQTLVEMIRRLAGLDSDAAIKVDIKGDFERIKALYQSP